MNFLVFASLALLSLTGASTRFEPAPSRMTAGVAPSPAGDDKQTEALFHKNQLVLESWLEHSASPRDWALASQLLAYPADQPAATKRRGGDLVRKAAAAAPDDRLVQWLWVQESPERSGCRTANTCPNRAGALAGLDPDNGAAWPSVITDAWERKDIAAVDEAIGKMAETSHYDDAFGVTFRAWEEVVRRYPPAKQPRPTTDTLTVRAFGLVEGSVKWTESKSMDDIDRSPAGVAFVLVMQGPWPMHPKLARACDRGANPNASARRFDDCGTIGRLLLEHSSFLLERFEGALVLRTSGTARASDIGDARALRWQEEKFGSLNVGQEAVAMDDYLTAYDTTNSEMAAMQHALQSAHIPLNPPVTWQPTRDGKIINPLGEWHPSRERL